MTDAWLKIVRDRRFVTGPTIPYVLAALRTPIGELWPTDKSRAQLLDLLITMRDSIEAPACVAIQRCSQIGAYVISAKNKAPTGRRRIQSPSYSDRALFTCEIDGYTVSDLEALSEALWATHAKQIDAGRFSREGGKWRAIDEAERDLIRATLAD